jgi:hypothetical protein
MTLRTGLIAVCAALLAIAIYLFVVGHGEGGVIVLVFEAGFILAAVVFERYRYNRPLAAPPGEGWEATGETFVDPGSGEALRVYFNPSTGKRVYVRVTGAKAG